jgi:hypothetical protein
MTRLNRGVLFSPVFKQELACLRVANGGKRREPRRVSEEAQDSAVHRRFENVRLACRSLGQS